MICPSCKNSEMWDNAQKNRERAAEGKKPMPLWGCKDKTCGHAIWPPKEGRSPARSDAPRPATSAKWASWDALSLAYGKAVDIGYKHMARVAKASGVPLSLEAVQSASATVFIESSKGGIQAEPTKLPEGLDDGDADLPY